MARSNTNVIFTYSSTGTQTFTISGGGSQIVDIDLQSLIRLMLMIKLYYAVTGDTSGCSLVLSDGYGEKDSTATGPIPCVLGGSEVPIFTTQGTSYTLNPVTTDSTEETSVTDIAIDTESTSRWLRVTLTNNDSDNACVVTMRGDY